jgi:polyhydroxyalkanoate synthesis regulator phasin
MKRLIWLPIAGFLLIAGATVAMAAPSLIDAAKGTIVGADPSPSPGTTTTGPEQVHPGQDLLNKVLADLVTKGTITQAQSDAITQGMQDEIAQRQADMQARRTLIESMVADGVITQDEINQLPADDPLRVAFDSIANDGQITLDQLRGLGGPGFGHGFMMGPGGPGFGHGGRMHGPGMWRGPDDGSNPGASPSPSTTSTSS